MVAFWVIVLLILGLECCFYELVDILLWVWLEHWNIQFWKWAMECIAHPWSVKIIWNLMIVFFFFFFLHPHYKRDGWVMLEKIKSLIGIWGLQIPKIAKSLNYYWTRIFKLFYCSNFLNCFRNSHGQTKHQNNLKEHDQTELETEILKMVRVEMKNMRTKASHIGVKWFKS